MTRYVAYQQWVDKTFEDSRKGIQWNQCLIDDGTEDLLDTLVKNEKLSRSDAFVIAYAMAYAEYHNQELQAELNNVRNELEGVLNNSYVQE